MSTSRKKPLTDAERAECARLKAAWEHYQSSHPGATQEWLASALGISQGGVAHYLNGYNALNIEIVARMSALMRVRPGTISARADQVLSAVAALYPDKEFADLTEGERELLKFLRHEGRTPEKRHNLAKRLAMMAIVWLGNGVPDNALDNPTWNASKRKR